MAIIDQLVTPGRPAACMLWPAATQDPASRETASLSDLQEKNRQLLIFQYWPASLQDDYAPEYAEHMIPGGTHPLYQWVGGRGRTISFQAVFTAEVNTTTRLGRAASVSLSPSRQYTTDVVGAIARIQSWMRPKYGNSGRVGLTSPPQILKLAFPGCNLGGIGTDVLTVILKQAPVNYESWFPNGEPRIATVDLTFNEIVQAEQAGNQRGRVTFIDRERFTKRADNRTINTGGNASVQNPLVGGL